MATHSPSAQSPEADETTTVATARELLEPTSVVSTASEADVAAEDGNSSSVKRSTSVALKNWCLGVKHSLKHRLGRLSVSDQSTLSADGACLLSVEQIDPDQDCRLKRANAIKVRQYTTTAWKMDGAEITIT